MSSAHPLMFCAGCLRLPPRCTCAYFHPRTPITPFTLPSTIDHNRKAHELINVEHPRAAS